MEPTYRIELRNVSKNFGEVKSLRNVDFKLGQNEVVGLLGDNGAGKSTLIKILTGYHQPSSGELYIDGKRIESLTVPLARTLGIETVYQERALAELQTLWRNIFLGRELRTTYGLLDVKKMKKETNKLMVRVDGFHFQRSESGINDRNLLRRREAGRGHRTCPLFRRRNHHSG